MLRNYLLNYLCDYLDDVILVELLLPVFGYGDKHNCLVGLAFDITWSVIIKTVTVIPSKVRKIDLVQFIRIRVYKYIYFK